MTSPGAGSSRPERSFILGIESSCDETAAAVISRDGEILSDVIASQIPIHARYGGVLPELASRNHLMAIGPVVKQALDKAGVGLDGICKIAATQGPGLIGALMVGLQVAKTLAWSRKIDLVPVHHVEGHITAILLSDGGEHLCGPLEFPYVALAVSGGHTSLYLVRKAGEYRLVGVTLDDAAGEAFDKVARLLDLPYPGGVHIDRVAATGNPAAISFPRPMLDRHSAQFSFSGLKTAVKVFVDKAKASGAPLNVPDIAASFQEAVVDVLLSKTFSVARRFGVAHVVLSGGVAANSRLRAKAVDFANEQGIAVHLTRPALCTDNAAMVANVARFKAPLPRSALLSLEPFASGQLGPELADAHE